MKYHYKYLLLLLLTAGFLFAIHKQSIHIYVDVPSLQQYLPGDLQQKAPNDLFVFSHGRPGELMIAHEWKDAGQLVAWLRQHIHPGIKAVRIFGCEFGKGEKGRAAVAHLQRALNLPVSASDNITGKDGDWTLEVGDVYTLEGLEAYPLNLQQCSGTVGQTGPGDDFDGDGVCNDTDIDDDNDGVLDVQEGYILRDTCELFFGLKAYNLVNNGDFEAGNQGFGSDYTFETGGSSGCNRYRIVNTGWTSASGTCNPSGLYMDINADCEAPYGNFWCQTITIKPNTIYRFGAKIRQGNYAEVGFLVNGVQQANFATTSSWVNREVSFNSGSNTTVTLCLKENTGVSNSADFGVDEIYLIDSVSFFSRDTDNDGVFNEFDTDSDGDGCSDAFEAGATTSTTASYQFSGTDANNNGLADAVQRGTSDSINYNSSYNDYAVKKTINACTDSDGDGVRDVNDIDDDNDGVPDATEAPACYYSSTEAMEAVSVSTSTISKVNNASVPEGEDIPTLRDGSTANASASNHVITSGQSFAGLNIYTIKYPTAVNLSVVNVIGGTTNWGTGTAATLYGSLDSMSWTLLMSDPLNTSTGTATKTFTVNQNAAAYRYYKIQGTAGTSTTITNYEVTDSLIASTYNPSAHPKESCTVDTDNDGVINTLDPDSDGDNCSDALEGGATTIATANYQFSGTDANGNGLIDAVEQGTSGRVNYASSYSHYATDNSIDACVDTDGDGIMDVDDIDDDNDGVLDETEADCAIRPVAKNGVVVSIPPNVSYTFNGNNTEANLVDSVDNNNYVLYNPMGTLNNAPLLIITFPQHTSLTYFEIGHYNGQTLFSAGSTYKIQASTDSVTWVDVTGTLTYNNTQTSVSGGYSTYNSNIAALTGNSNVYHYYRIFGINVTSGGGWATELYFEEYTCNNPDTDNDNVPNRLDTDSDGDGCSDAFEAGATTSTTASYQFSGTDANNNGLADAVQRGTSDSINYNSSYNDYAVKKNINACTDSDGDGVRDVNDIDDDNDGVPDATEAPACYYSSTEAMEAVSVSTSTISKVNNASVPEGEDIPTLRDGSTANASASNHVITSGQSFAGLNIYTIKYPTAVNLSVVNVIGGTANWGSGTAATLYGSLDSMSWTLLMSDPLNTSTGTATKTFTVNQNAAAYRYYKIQGTAGTSATITNYEITDSLIASTYNPSAHPKESCTVDTDNDGIINTLDLDSDGDNCSDALEGGATTTTTANYQFSGTDANGNGLIDVVEQGTSGRVNYASSYSHYATDNSIDACVDTDGDGIMDVDDIDDDNDGVLDETEADCAIRPVAKNGVVVSIPPNVSYTFNGNNTEANLVDSVDNNNVVLYNPMGTLNNAPLLIVTFPQHTSLTYFEIGHYNGQTLFSAGSTYKIQASTDSVTWVDVTGTLTYNNTQTSVSGGYSTYNSNIAALTGNSNVYHYYRIFGINVTSGGGWATELYFEEYTCNNPDTDNDNVPNRLDTDSDGDGCSDAFEAGATTSTTASYQFSGTDANDNGLIDEIQKGTSDSINYVSDYKKYAINNVVNACADTDGDGANDINDLDDDNDGVLDAIEAPRCYYSSTEAMKAVSVSTSMISRVNNVSIVEGEDIPTLRDGSTANSGAANHNIGSGQSFANVNIYTIKYPTAVNLNSLSVTGGTGNWGTGTAATLYGSNDSTIWTLLMSDPQSTTSGAVKTFTVNQNAAQYRYYQLRGTAGTSTSITNYEVGGALNAGTYNPSAHPKDTCTVDADSDGIVNARDLDSDGDGCTDAVEADVAKSSGGPTMQPGVVKNGSNGEVTSETNTSNAVVSGPYGNNGFANSIETGEESGGYNSTYTYANATDGMRDPNCDNLSVVLPVRLLEFTARTQGGVVLVAWKTTNEVDNDYFEVERSAGNTQWEVIGRVKGQNIPGVHQYRLTDAAPLEGIAYYRLKQKDFDGTFTYSEVRMVNNVPDELLKLYPNPAQSYISVSMAALRQSDITICDLLGKNITAMVTVKQTGNGTFQIDVQRLANGMYMLKAKGKVIAFVKG